MSAGQSRILRSGFGLYLRWRGIRQFRCSPACLLLHPAGALSEAIQKSVFFSSTMILVHPAVAGYMPSIQLQTAYATLVILPGRVDVGVLSAGLSFRNDNLANAGNYLQPG
jgi:hypothetical protein